MLNSLLKTTIRFHSQAQIMHSKLLIIGGGDAGLSLATRLSESSQNLFAKQNKVLDGTDITVVDKKEKYIYQSGQTLVGGGLTTLDDITVDYDTRAPSDINRINQLAQKIIPEENRVVLEDGTELSYDYLVLALGTHPQLDLTPGLRESLENEAIPVATNYLPEYAVKMNKLRSEFKGGNAIFTMPQSPIKCGGAPLKITYLSCSSWKNKQIKYNAKYYTGTPAIFGNTFYVTALEKQLKRYGVEAFTQHELVEVKGKDRIAVFKNLKTGDLIEQPFDILHATPVMKAPAILAEAGLTNPNSYVNVNINTLQHNVFPNIFSLGDCADLPTSKTLSAVNDQLHILADNLDRAINEKPLQADYHGYTACPVLVGGGKVILCEFGYDQKVMQTFSKDQREPSGFFYFLKTKVFNQLALRNKCGHVRGLRQFFSSLSQTKEK